MSLSQKMADAAEKRHYNEKKRNTSSSSVSFAPLPTAKRQSPEASVGRGGGGGGGGGWGGGGKGGGDDDYSNGGESDWAFHCAEEDRKAIEDGTLVYESKLNWLCDLRVDIKKRQEDLSVLVTVHGLLEKLTGQDTTALLQFGSVGEEVRLMKQSTGENSSSKFGDKDVVLQTLKMGAADSQDGACLIIKHGSMTDSTVLHCGSVACYFGLNGRNFVMKPIYDSASTSVHVNGQALANNTSVQMKHNDSVDLAPNVSFKFFTEKGLKREAGVVLAEGPGKANSSFSRGMGGSA